MGGSILALAVGLAASPFDPDDSVPALLFLAAVGMTAWLGGLGPAIIPFVIGSLAIDYFFEKPRYMLELSTTRTAVDIASFLLVAAIVGLLNHRLRLANTHLRFERDRAEAAVEARNELIATVSHALRTPLTTIKTSLFSLEEDCAHQIPERRQRLLAVASEEADRLIRFVIDALELNRLESGPAPRIELNDVGEIVWVAVDHCLPLLGDRPVALDVPELLPMMHFDAHLLDRAVTALLENVAMHTPPHTGVWIKGEISHAADLRLTVSDAGPGIPPADRERAFVKYERINEQSSGVGLGLAVARAAIQLQGGRLWVEGSPYGGSCFVIVIPGAVRQQRSL
jgi:two-component system sensor histidine kinase KdpD